ncbi:MAG: hypothetical protein H7836_11390 [Magnetococcus sp. YQC-3]
MKKFSSFFLFFTLLIGFFLVMAPFNGIVSAASPVPDSGSDAKMTINYTVNRYDDGIVGYKVSRSLPWAMVWTGAGNFLSTSGNMWCGWNDNYFGDSNRYGFRYVFWFDLASSIFLNCVDAWLNITAHYDGSAAFNQGFYVRYWYDQSPPPTASNYLNCLQGGGLANVNEWDADSTVQHIHLDLDAVDVGVRYAPFALVCDDDFDTVASASGEHAYIVVDAITLTVQVEIGAPVCTSASPRSVSYVSNNTTLTAVVRGAGSYLYSGVAYLQSNSTGSWVTLQSKILTYFNQESFSKINVDTHGNGKYWWRIVTKIMSTNLETSYNYWNNYTFWYNIGNGTGTTDPGGGTPPGGGETGEHKHPDASGMYIELVQYNETAICVGEQIAIRTYVPLTVWHDAELDRRNIVMWATDPNGDLLPWFSGYHDLVPPMTFVVYRMVSMDTWNDVGACTLWIGDKDLDSGYYEHLAYYTFNLTGYDSGYKIYPRDGYIFTAPANIWTRAWMPGVFTQYYMLLSYMNGTIVANHSIYTGLVSGYIDDVFINVGVGTYYLTLLDNTFNQRNISTSIKVFDKNSMNGYSILVPRTYYKLNDTIELTVNRYRGSGGYEVVVYSPTKQVYHQLFSDDSAKVYFEGLELGKYHYYVYDLGGSLADGNRIEGYFYVTSDGTKGGTGGPGDGGDDDDGDAGVFDAISEYVPYGVFATLCILGLLAANFLKTPMGFPITLFGGMFMCSIPGTPLFVFPVVFLFVAGLILCLFILYTLKRG